MQQSLNKPKVTLEEPVGSTAIRSKLYLGHVSHARCEPPVHRFKYPFYTFAVDLSELNSLDESLLGFSYNRRGVFSIWDEDYLPGFEGSIFERVSSVLEGVVERQSLFRVELVSNPRFLGYVFNPVSFFRCYSEQEELLAAVVQVNNTFGETHIYRLESPQAVSKFDVFKHCKEFHVSPFNDMSGEYKFYFGKGETLDLRINMEREGTVSFTSQLRGEPKVLEGKNLFKTLLRYPFDLVLTSPRILFEAARLYFSKKLPVYTKPIPSSRMTTVVSPASSLQKFAQARVYAFLSKVKRGTIEIEIPGEELRTFGGGEEPKVRMFVKNYDFFTKCMFSGDIGFGESYVEQHWESDDLTLLLEILANNDDVLNDKSMLSTWLGRPVNFLGHLLRSNSKAGSKKNISAHYDLSNELFESFLDPSMVYSCAYFPDEKNTLAEAQQAKIDRLIEKAQLKKEDSVLEIGCGWGAFAITAAKRIGCHVTGITLSKEQKKYAEERIREEGLEELITIELRDYRDVKGSFDKIVSIEMLEAVGHSYFASFFETLERVLKPNGLVALQVITFPDANYDSYRRGADWIQKYIFPGGICPSLTALSQSMKSHSNFIVEELENIGIHYARTLEIWRHQFFENSSEVKKLGFDTRFIRIWEYYLCYCEAGFRTRTIGTLQLVLTRPKNENLPNFKRIETESN